MGQLSIFNIGTGHNKAETNNLLVALHRDCPSRDATGLASSRGGSWKFINDGPGSTDEGSGFGARIASVGGNALGTGSTRGVMAATDAMVELVRNTQPDRVNIAGHSRGAITSIRIAAKLYEWKPDLPVYLFLVDPVKRMGRGTDFYNRELHPNVTAHGDVLVVVMEDVGDKALFKTLSLKTRGSHASKRQHLATDRFIRMPGSHGTATQVDWPIGRVTFQMARQFFSRNGAPVGTGIWTDAQVCEEYFQVTLSNPMVTRHMGKTVAPSRLVNDNGVTKLVAKSSRVDRLDGLGIENRFRAHPVFVNEHHYDLFAARYPLLAAKFGDDRRVSTGDRFQVEVARLQIQAPNGYAVLNGLNLI